MLKRSGAWDLRSERTRFACPTTRSCASAMPLPGMYAKCACRKRGSSLRPASDAKPLPSGLMVPSGLRFSGLVAGLEGLGMKLKSADFAEEGIEGLVGAAPALCDDSWQEETSLACGDEGTKAVGWLR